MRGSEDGPLDGDTARKPIAPYVGKKHCRDILASLPMMTGPKATAKAIRFAGSHLSTNSRLNLCAVRVKATVSLSAFARSNCFHLAPALRKGFVEAFVPPIIR